MAGMHREILFAAQKKSPANDGQGFASVRMG